MLALLLTALRVHLNRALPVRYLPGALHDHAWYLGKAMELAAGHWLGPYDHMTLIRPPGYPLWIALCAALGLPLKVAETLLWVAACALAVRALRPLLASAPMRLALFAFLLFNPASVVVTDVLREGVYTSEVLLAVACSAALWLRRASSLRHRLAWAVGLGLSLGAVWLTREEGVWTLPVLALPLLGGLVVVRARPAAWRAEAAVLLATAATWLAMVGSVMAVNAHAYGVLAVSEVQGRPFLEAYGALTSVRGGSWERDVPVPASARARIYEVSPAFRELAVFLEGDLGKGWAREGFSLETVRTWWANGPEAFRADLERGAGVSVPLEWPAVVASLRKSVAERDRLGALLATKVGGWQAADELFSRRPGEIRGGWFYWALRDAAARAGHHASAAAASAYYRQLAVEVRAACEGHRLECTSSHATLMPPWDRRYLEPALETTGLIDSFLVRFDLMEPPLGPSAGDPAALARASAFLHERLGPVQVGPSSRLRVRCLFAIARLYHALLPFLLGVALALLAFVLPSRRAVARELAPVAGLLLTLAVSRAALLALVTVTSFPFEERYLLPAHPLLLLLVGVSILASLGTLLETGLDSPDGRLESGSPLRTLPPSAVESLVDRAD